MHNSFRIAFAALLLTSPLLAQSRQAPPGMFKDCKQLFIDNFVIESLASVKKVLNQPVKHPKNPLVRRDKPWEEKLSRRLAMARSSAMSAIGCTRFGIRSGTTIRTPSGRWTTSHRRIAEEGTLTTKPLVFLGDTLVVNANATGGSLTVEVLDAEGKVIEGFGTADCAPITADSVRHVLKWKDNPDCHLLQARPVKLRFRLQNTKPHSFEPKIRYNHYLQLYV